MPLLTALVAASAVAPSYQMPSEKPSTNATESVLPMTSGSTALRALIVEEEASLSLVFQRCGFETEVFHH